jgi:acetyltransferase-like isoleucine patch superfamily enzyme/dTDP-4-dehydrorhamnose 3,5-epimerase-like enzyme
MNYFKHPYSLVETDNIGNSTRIWAFAHILPGAVIGDDCNICDHVFVENDVRIGNRVTIKCGVQIWNGVTLEDDVFVGPNATFINDLYPRSKKYLEESTKTIIRCGASVGANATILAGIVVGKNAMIGAGAVVTKDVPPNAIVVGNPARISGYVNSASAKQPVAAAKPPIPAGQLTVSQVSGAVIHQLPLIEDMRGSLSFAEYGQYLPFVPRRYFLVFDVKSKEVRGEHAHKKLHQFLICVKGSCSVVVDDGNNREEIVLNSPATGLHISPMIWGIQYKYSADAVLLVLASDSYDADDYIRDYDEFLEAVRR